MPRDERHTQKALRNEQFAAELDNSSPIKESWAITAFFYSALHYVQAVLATGGADSFDHKTRAKEIARDPILRYIAGAYDHLQKLSILARYHVNALPDRAYTMARADLEAVKKQVEKAG